MFEKTFLLMKTQQKHFSYCILVVGKVDLLFRISCLFVSRQHYLLLVTSIHCACSVNLQCYRNQKWVYHGLESNSDSRGNRSQVKLIQNNKVRLIILQDV